jgi:hypothetical protein
MQPKNSPQTFSGTIRVLVISEATARKGFADILDFWWRDHETGLQIIW